MPHIKNNNMELSEKRKELISKLEGIFDVPVRTFSVPSKGIPVTTTVTVDKVDKNELVDIAELAVESEVWVEMKRSGTGITIKFI